MSIRMRHTKGHSGNRRSHHALKQLAVIKDEAGNMRLPHRLDEATGMYNGKQIITPKSRTAPKEKKVKTVDTAPAAPHIHDHARDHANAELKNASASKGFFGKFTGGGRPKARSGAGGGGA